MSGYGAGAYVIGSGTETYVEAAATSQSGTWDVVPVIAANGIDLSTPGLTAGTAGFSDWVGIQLKTAASGASSGDGGSQSWTIVWDEV